MARRNERRFQLPLFERERRRQQDRFPQRRLPQQGFLQQGRRQERDLSVIFAAIHIIVFVCTQLNSTQKIETYDSSWFLEKIYHIVTLLDTHFPYGVSGIAFSLLFIITLRLIIVQKNFHRLSAEHNRCREIHEIFHFLLEEHMKCGDIQENFDHLSAEYSDIQQNFQRLSAEHKRCRKDKKKLDSNLKHMTLLSQTETEKSKKQNQHIEQLEICIEQLEKSVQDEKDKRLCIICDDQIRTIVLLPCKHMCMCKKCLGRKTWKTCPLCRKPIDTNMEIYV